VANIATRSLDASLKCGNERVVAGRPAVDFDLESLEGRDSEFVEKLAANREGRGTSGR
jgi:hypothetical protein